MGHRGGRTGASTPAQSNGVLMIPNNRRVKIGDKCKCSQCKAEGLLDLPTTFFPAPFPIHKKILETLDRHGGGSYYTCQRCIDELAFTERTKEDIISFTICGRI